MLLSIEYLIWISIYLCKSRATIPSNTNLGRFCLLHVGIL